MSIGTNLTEKDISYLNTIYQNSDFKPFASFIEKKVISDCLYYNIPFLDIEESKKGCFLFNKGFEKKQNIDSDQFFICQPFNKVGSIIVLISDSPTYVIQQFLKLNNKYKNCVIKIIVPGVISKKSIKLIKELHPNKETITVFSKGRNMVLNKLITSSVYHNKDISTSIYNGTYTITSKVKTIETETLNWAEIQRQFRLFSKLKHY